jgi:pyruvate formate lyase activating enzyme
MAAVSPHAARYWERVTGLPDASGGSDSVRCTLCPNRCIIREGCAGRCRIRINEGGSLAASAYGVVSSLALDPIEKKPFAHYYPGSFILSLGSFGCNLSCKFCQNHEISQTGVPSEPLERTFAGRAFARHAPEELVAEARTLIPRGNIGLAYTYNEPFTNFEFVSDTAILSREAGLKNVLVTNGYVNPEPLAEIAPYIDAMNIDLKSWTDSFYSEICGGRIEPVKATIETLAARYPSCHIEITTLLIPGFNSARDEIASLSGWLASISPDIPLHLTRHHPDYLMSSPGPIEVRELLALADLARKKLNHVHCGNI